ncbi:MAG TPA: formate dehydrogenase accessory protein FdhE [Burkholderiaceae bacterium]|nr:formate dehydrogenase accessory protein FdhE [Burkholderiaceae bacterium]
MAKSGESIVRIMPAEEIVARGGGQAERLLWPQRASFFAERAMRLRQLSRKDSATAGYLAVMADVAMAQQECLADFPDVPLPDEKTLDHARQLAIAPLGATSWTRHEAWRDCLRSLVEKLRGKVADTITPVLDKLSNLSDDELEQQADLLLSGVSKGLDVACAPFIGAALQVYWVHMITSCDPLREAEIYAAHDLDNEPTCPCCGSYPTASVTRASGSVAGQRYLSCSLCGTQWNMVRIKCSNCMGTENITYMSLDVAGPDQDESDEDAEPARNTKPATLAETCGDCGVYLKIFHTDRDPFVDPVADDLATVTLDVLLADDGKIRHGTNLMLVFSNPEPVSSPQSTQ